MKSFLLLFSAVFVGFTRAQDFVPICGDCWCISGNETCPTFGPNIAQSFTAELSSTYASFVLSGDPIALKDSDGNACFPFKDTVGERESYPESAYNQCVLPTSTTGVCAFKFLDSACQGRTYEVKDYASPEAAILDGAVVTHKGACGVCSNAKDLSVRMINIDSLSSKTLLCSVSYALSGSNPNRFADLVTCIQEIGFTQQCGELWSHYGATNGNLCAFDCSAGITGDVELNGPAPDCELSTCLQCSGNLFQEEFDLLSGRTLAKSGITEAIARPCSAFYPVDHDPCASVPLTIAPVAPTVSSAPVAPTVSDAPVTPAPTAAPVSSAPVTKAPSPTSGAMIRNVVGILVVMVAMVWAQ